MHKGINRLFSFILAAVCMITVIASSPVAANAATPSIKLDTASYTFPAVGKTYVFLANISPNPKNINCSSNNSAIAIVQPMCKNEKGYYFKITSKSIGTTKINVTANGITSSFLVTVPDPNIAPNYKLNEPFYFKDAGGNNLYNVTITGISKVKNGGTPPTPTSELLWITYSYTNIARHEYLNIASNHFTAIDSKGAIGHYGMPTIEMLDENVYTRSDLASVGSSNDAGMLIWINNPSDRIQLQFKDNIERSIDAIFTIDVPQ